MKKSLAVLWARPMRLALHSLGVGPAVAGLLLACGPSVQAVQEGTLRFEHCYRLDMTQNTAAPHRRACWQEWTTRYTYGQSRDRIEYARRRLRTMGMGDTRPLKLALDTEPAPGERRFYLSVPTSPYAPPAPMATPTDQPPAGPPLPADECAGACRIAFTQCTAPCEPSAGPPGGTASSEVGGTGGAGTQAPAEPRPHAQPGGPAPRGSSTAAPDSKPPGAVSDTGTGCQACEPDYKACMQRCYQ